MAKSRNSLKSDDPDLRDLTDEQIASIGMEESATLWCHYNQINLGHSTYDLKNHRYQVDVLDCGAKKQVCKKGAQMGFSEAYVLDTLHGMCYNKYPTGVLYLFPTGDDVTEYSKSRFNPLIENNACIKSHVRNTDSATIKQVGNGFLYFRGARATKEIKGKKSSTKLKSISVDRIVFDERDEMLDSMVTLAQERVSHSRIQQEVHLSTPTIPGFGVDKLYEESDQRVWMIKCRVCGTETCLELEFPNCILEKDGKYYRACKKCKNEIHPINGKWVALYPGREWVGWWISQLNSMYIDPGNILKLYNDPPEGNLTEVMNSKLGMAHIPAENKLNENDIWARCGADLMDVEHDGPCCMGVDVGKINNVVIACKPNETTLKIVKVAEVSDFNDVHDLAQKFNVKCAVFDLYPETRKVREFQNAASFEVFGCDYRETQRGNTFFDENSGIVRTNRNEVLDATHNLVIERGRLELPRTNSELEKYVKQMCNTAKVLMQDEFSGHKEYRYRKLGGSMGDHYRHATNYCLLASERIGITKKNNWFWGYLGNRKDKRRTWMTA